MKNPLLILTFLISSLFAFERADACIATSAYGSLTADTNTFAVQTIETCNYAGEYATVTLPAAGIWTFSSEVATDFLTITTTGNVGIDSGVASVSIQNTGPVTVRVHIHTNSSCGTQNTCRDTYVQRQPCLSNTQYPSNTVNASATYNSSTNIANCNYAGEYARVYLPAPGNWQFTNSAGDYITVTNLDNEVLASGQDTVVYTSSFNTDTVKVHYFTTTGCGTQSTCRTTTVTRLPCISNTMYPSSVDTANTTPVPMTVTTCNYAGEYYEAVLYTGNTYEFTSSDTNDIFYFTDTNNNFFFAQQTPATANVTGTGVFVVRVHIFNTFGCGTDNSCRTTQIKCLTCPVPPPTLVANDSVMCAGDAPVTLSAQNTFTGTVYWFENSCGGTPIDSGNSTTVNPSATTWYYVANSYESQLSTCDSIEVVVNDLPSVVLNDLSNVSCFGFDDGSIDVMGSGTVGPYGYDWSNADTTAMIEDLAPMSYTVTVTDANGCTALDTFDITEPTELLGGIDTTMDVVCDGDSNGSATASATGGTGNVYAYSWSNGFATATASDLDQGVHYVTITDSNGCTVVDSAVIGYLHENPTIDMEDSAMFCTGFSTSLDAGNNGSLFSWSNGDTSQVVEIDSAGTYSVTVTDTTGCFSSRSVVVVEDTCLGIDEVGLLAFELYPNPTQDWINIRVSNDMNDAATIELIDINGRLVMTDQIKSLAAGQSQRISLNHIAKGSYLVKLTYQNKQYMHRVIVQ